MLIDTRLQGTVELHACKTVAPSIACLQGGGTADSHRVCRAVAPPIGTRLQGTTDCTFVRLRHHQLIYICNELHACKVAVSWICNTQIAFSPRFSHFFVCYINPRTTEPNRRRTEQFICLFGVGPFHELSVRVQFGSAHSFKIPFRGRFGALVRHLFCPFPTLVAGFFALNDLCEEEPPRCSADILPVFL
jgi:hypothetical protein